MTKFDRRALILELLDAQADQHRALERQSRALKRLLAEEGGIVTVAPPPPQPEPKPNTPEDLGFQKSAPPKEEKAVDYRAEIREAKHKVMALCGRDGERAKQAWGRTMATDVALEDLNDTQAKSMAGKARTLVKKLELGQAVNKLVEEYRFVSGQKRPRVTEAELKSVAHLEGRRDALVIDLEEAREKKGSRQ